jgi:hypothetical protein
MRGEQHARFAQSRQAFQYAFPADVEAGQDRVKDLAVDLEESSVVRRTHFVARQAVRSAAEVAHYNNDKRAVVARLFRGALLVGLDIGSQSHLRSPIVHRHLTPPRPEVIWPSRAFRMPRGDRRAITVL